MAPSAAQALTALGKYWRRFLFVGDVHSDVHNLRGDPSDLHLCAKGDLFVTIDLKPEISTCGQFWGSW